MRVFFSVGEPSGDLHGANLIADLRTADPGLEAVGFGGPKMAASGCQLLFDLTGLAVMGLWNVLANLRQFFRWLAEADRYLASHAVDAVVLIDYPGFNWWIARQAKRRGIPVFYYGVPQMWAWAPWRVRKLRRLVDHVLCKLPFEADWFRQRGCPAEYVGHPYFDELHRYQPDQRFLQEYDDPDSRLLVLLPGSRTQEVRRNLAMLLESGARVCQTHPNTAVAVACFGQQHAEYARQLCRHNRLPFDVMVGRTPELVSLADACIACSGSVSLELLYHRTPSVIVYRIGRWSGKIGLMLLRTRFITLVNLLAAGRICSRAADRYDPDDRGRTDVPMPEYLTHRNCAERVAAWINEWFSDDRKLAERALQLDRIASDFATPGGSARAANFIVQQVGQSVPVPQNVLPETVRRAA